MVFNSLEFAIFFPVVFLFYWVIPKKFIKVQNVLLFLASYIFYGWWDWRFLILIFISSWVDFIISARLDRTEHLKTRKLLVAISVCVNLGLLCYFKYVNFFITSFNEAFTLFGSELEMTTLRVILPVGISFYTFQTLSYTLDVYKKKMAASNDFVAFFTYVAFFPQLVAGPIERARHLLPQFGKERSFDFPKAMDGMGQIAWGLFKKMVVADTLAITVNDVFADPAAHSGSTLYLAAVFFAFQLYCDFSGYSDIAIGSAKLLGFKLSKNFAFPLFSRDLVEFWQRWHISLTNWFRDYVFIPMTLGKNTKYHKVKNTFILFLLIGIWHGADYNFVVFGIMNGLIYAPSIIFGRKKWKNAIVSQGRVIPRDMEFPRMVLFMSTVMVFLMFLFRIESLDQGFAFLNGVFSTSFFTAPDFELFHLVLILVFISIEWIGREKEYAIERLHQKYPAIIVWSIYTLLFIITYFFKSPAAEYIYFQF